jgi:hypothetical protein
MKHLVSNVVRYRLVIAAAAGVAGAFLSQHQEDCLVIYPPTVVEIFTFCGGARGVQYSDGL